MMNYGGYKIQMGTQFPTYRSTYEQAKTCAWNYTMSTGKNAKVYGIDEQGCHHLLTTRKNPPRT